MGKGRRDKVLLNTEQRQKLESLSRNGYAPAGKICTVIDLVTRLPVEVWFNNNPAASDTNFETALLNLLSPKTLILLDRGFYHFQFLQQLIDQEVNFITRLKAKASIKYLKIFSYDHSLKDRLIQLGTVRRGAPVLTLRLIEIKIGFY